MSRVYVMGFIGAGNAGDEAILAGTLYLLRQRGVTDIGVFSWNPSETERVHQVQAFPVLPGLTGIRAFAGVIKRGDLLLLGGGSLLQDGEPRIIPFWLSRALAAKAKGCTVVFHAQGIGPLRTLWARIMVRVLVPLTASLVTVRDESSAQLVRYASPHLVADPALALPPLPAPQQSHLAVVAVRKCRGRAAQEAELVAALRRLAEEHALNYAFLPMHIPDDTPLAEDFVRRCGGSVVRYTSLAELREVLAAAQIVIAMRLHAAILAAGVGTPVVGLAYDPKVRAFFHGLGLERAVLPWDEEFRGENLAQVVREVLAEGVAQKAATAHALTQMSARAALAVDLALALSIHN
ncbi:MAG: hypothetical protein DDT37_01177 [Firmicutes bacterium]|nr:hypothetical protein [candidate division NPL-UPA2 bacterium]